MQLHYEHDCKHEYLVSCKNTGRLVVDNHGYSCFDRFPNEPPAIIVQSRSRSRLPAIFGLSDVRLCLVIFNFFYVNHRLQTPNYKRSGFSCLQVTGFMFCKERCYVKIKGVFIFGYTFVILIAIFIYAALFSIIMISVVTLAYSFEVYT